MAAVAAVGRTVVPVGCKNDMMGVKVNDMAITGPKSVFINSDTCNIVGLVTD